jgi:ABC-type phosphate/phosphonate transport system substrate-binding protein
MDSPPVRDGEEQEGVMLLKYSWLAISLFIAFGPVNAELVFTAPPRESKQAGEEQYGPLAEFFSEQLGQPVTYQHPGNWLTYQSNMRAGKYDIVFDGPHFAAWRQVHLQHDMLVKLPGYLQFYLLARAGDSKINKPDDLIGKKICGISPPNLSTLSMLAIYSNPVRQPIIKGIKGGMGKVHKAFLSGQCEAMVLRTAFYHKKLKPEQREKLKIIYTTARMPQQVISVGDRISGVEKQKLQNYLLKGQKGQKALMPTLKRFGGKARSFVRANNAEYQGYNMLLEGVIFGW